jgi:hypothetical protein
MVVCVRDRLSSSSWRFGVSDGRARVGRLSGDARPQQRRQDRSVYRPYHAAVRRRPRASPPSCRPFPRQGDRTLAEDSLVRPTRFCDWRLPCDHGYPPQPATRPELQAGVQLRGTRLPDDHQSTQRRLLAIDVYQRKRDQHSDGPGDETRPIALRQVIRARAATARRRSPRQAPRRPPVVQARQCRGRRRRVGRRPRPTQRLPPCPRTPARRGRRAA